MYSVVSSALVATACLDRLTLTLGCDASLEFLRELLSENTLSAAAVVIVKEPMESKARLISRIVLLSTTI